MATASSFRALVAGSVLLLMPAVASAQAGLTWPTSRFPRVTFIEAPASQPAQAGQVAPPEAALTRFKTTFTLAPNDADQQSRPKAFEYSDAYHTRAKIHRYASFATLPLFGAEAWVGESLYRNPTAAKRSAHLAIAAGMGALFVVNTVTGVWNLVESRKDPNHRPRRFIHGILMMAADAGFLAAMATAPGHHHGLAVTTGPSSRAALHRTMAFTSIGLTTVGYFVMILGK